MIICPAASAVPASADAIELALFDDPLMRLGSTFNLILKVVAFGRQKLRDLISAAGAGAERARGVIDRLTDLEFVAGHGSPRCHVDRIRRPATALSVCPDRCPAPPHKGSLAEAALAPD